MCDLSTISADEFHSLRVIPRDILIGREIMDKTSGNIFREIVYVPILAINCIIFKNGYDLIIGLAIIQQAQTSDRTRSNDDIPVSNILFRQHTDVKRIAIALYIVSRK